MEKIVQSEARNFENILFMLSKAKQIFCLEKLKIMYKILVWDFNLYTGASKCEGVIKIVEIYKVTFIFLLNTFHQCQ